MPYLRTAQSGVEIRVKVVPGASRDRLAGILGDALKVQVSARPERGKANEAVAGLIADALGVDARRVTLKSGGASPRKTFLVNGVDAATVRIRLDKRK